MRILVTGGAGFIGSNFVRHILKKQPDWKIINLDLLTYAGNLDNLTDIADLPNYRFVKGDIGDYAVVDYLFSEEVDVVVNFAAESHVDRSIEDAAAFVRTNILGTHVLLDAARRYWVRKQGSGLRAQPSPLFIQVSTDEVYGSLGPEGYFTEETPLAPNSPYSASKAGADLLCRAYFETHGLPVIITRCSNNYGPYQYPGKLIPLMISNALEGKPLPVYGDGLNIRDWLYVDDHCRAIEAVILKGKPGEVYNVGGNNEWKNIDIVNRICDALVESGVTPHSLITYIKDRPGHDRRYAIDSSKIQRELGWQPTYDFETGLRATVNWYLQNREWWERLKSRAR